MRVLVVEDEEIMGEALVLGLRRSGYAVDLVTDGAAALDQAAVNHYDVVLLDRDLPVVHGDEVCRRLVRDRSPARILLLTAAVVRDRSPARILLLTAAGTVAEKVDGFALGADDYLPKPFAFAELLARVDALARRTTPAVPPRLRVGEVAVDTARREVTRNGRPVQLTLKEYGVLAELARAGGAVVSAEDLLERVWDEHADSFSNAVRVTMVGLRRKLGEPPVIETLRGAGYRLCS